jgi:hypothetical protein
VFEVLKRIYWFLGLLLLLPHKQNWTDYMFSFVYKNKALRLHVQVAMADQGEEKAASQDEEPEAEEVPAVFESLSI